MKFHTFALILFGVTKALDSLLDTDDTVSAMMRLLKGETGTSTDDIRTLLGSAASSSVPEPRRRPRAGRTNVQERQKMVQELKERLQLLEQKETDLKELERDLKKKKKKLDKQLMAANDDASTNVVRARQLAGTEGRKVRKLRERIDELEDKLKIAGIPPSSNSDPFQAHPNQSMNRPGLTPFGNSPGQPNQPFDSPEPRRPISTDPEQRSADLDKEIKRKEKIRRKLNEVLNRLAERLVEKVSQLKALHGGQMPIQTPSIPGTVPGQMPAQQPVTPQPWQQQQQLVQPWQQQQPVPQVQPWQQQPNVQPAQPWQQQPQQAQPWTPTQQPQFQQQPH